MGAIPGSREPSPASGLGPTGFDPERDCRDCGGTGYGGHGPHIEFCTCTAGELAISFHRADPAAYMKWLLERADDGQ